ncbi:MAG: class I tRNA ligase family protein [Candidatus Paceibacterota bacterium]|jgi:leucyl-tRNA synthetase
MKEYNHLKIESKWQKEWEKKGIYHAENPTKDGASNSKKPKYYSLIEFPYPSGEGLHVGHPRPYIGMDIISRKRRLQGYNVLYPIGWDAFGLPTENYAIKTGKDPRVVTKKNTDTFRKQIQSLGISFDWSREINTTDPKYYKWTQWIFLQFLKKGLAYKKKMEINWCPKDKIGLANEEVITRSTGSGQAGYCERCGTPVEKREKEQWMLAITKYADRLYKDLDEVDYLPQIKLGQRNWIGKSEGAEIDFKIKDSSEKIKIFTTRADTIFGAFAVILAPEHELVQKSKSQIKNFSEVEKYLNEVKKKTDIERTSEDKDKTGIELKGLKAINPVNNEEIPIWIADFILVQYGTGAVFADMHDERDFAFAKKYKMSMRQSVMPLFEDKVHPWVKDKKIVERKAIHAVIRKNNGDILLLYWKGEEWKGKPPVTFVIGGVENGENLIDAAMREIREETGFLNLKFVEQLPISTQSRFFAAHKDVNRIANVTCLVFDLINEDRAEVDKKEKKLHDWKFVSVNKVAQDLNIEDDKLFFNYLNKPSTFVGEGVLIDSGKFTGMPSVEARQKIIKEVGGKIVTKFKLRDWVFSRQRYWGEPIPVIFCNTCGTVPVPEKDLPVELPKVKNYQPTDSGESPLANIKSFVDTRCPLCKGKAKRETDTMPNWAGSSWYYLRYVDSKNNKAFAGKKNLEYWLGNDQVVGGVNWYNGGNEHTTLHLLYSRFWHKFLYDLKLVPTNEPYMKRTSHGMILGEGGVKMSKSLGNVINPNEIVKTYGADTMRVYEMFMGPFDQSVAWSTESIIGARRFIEKVWRIQAKLVNDFERSGRGRDPENRGPEKLFTSEAYINLKRLLHKTIKKVSEDIEDMRFNTAVSSMMILATEMEKAENVSVDDFKMFLKILSPFAPHVTEELWSMLGEKKTINLSEWPKWEESLIKDEEVKIMVQINGKVRGEIIIHVDEQKEDVRDKALKDADIVKYVEGKDIKRIIYVKGRLINIVL